jgi:hypothetical protein
MRFKAEMKPDFAGSKSRCGFGADGCLLTGLSFGGIMRLGKKAGFGRRIRFDFMMTLFRMIAANRSLCLGRMGNRG